MPPAAAITHKDNLEFLDDTIPKTQPYRDVKQKAAETRAKLTGTKAPTADTAEGSGSQLPAAEDAQTNGSAKKQKTLSNGFGLHDAAKKPVPSVESTGNSGDVEMTG